MFTWWRRFHTPFKLKPKDLWKGRSELLQRIEFGEFEYDPLWQQSYLEDYILEEKTEAIKIKFARSNADTIEEKIRDERKKMRKRQDIMREKHLINENKLLVQLSDALAKEFDMDREFVDGFMESFDGTTRELYFNLLCIKYEKPLLESDDIQMIPRTVNQQPRHYIKRSEQDLLSMWDKTIIEKNIW